AVAADDFLVSLVVAPGQGGGRVRYQTIGSGSTQRTVVEWTGVAHFTPNPPDSNTFQAILYANGNIEYRYGVMTGPEITPTGGTAGFGYIRGIESESGVGSIDLSGPNGEQTAPVAGSTVFFTYNSDPGNLCPSGPTCACDFNANGSLNSQDFFDFLAAFFTAAPGSDFNGDMVVNSQDFFDFLACFFAPPPGC
ncbi:MAG: hypothetical protein H7210_14480, partial [Pyrinomonadaceae bacterium]|nr:hypothetical protein [Phycisphaerales bacterium]